MELGGGGGEGAAAEGEDRLGALPDDVLVLIVRKLNTRSAAETRVLSHRWRRIWALLPELWFFTPREPHWLRDALDDHKVLLHRLFVMTDGATAESLDVWLPAAARRVSGELKLQTFHPVEHVADYDSDEEEEEEEEVARRGAFELPCFEQATRILFFLDFQGLAVPVTGVFARLTELYLSRVWFHGPGELGVAVSSPRCPCLQRLTVENARGLRDLAIHSESMLFIKLSDLATLSQLTVVAPALKELIVESCFHEISPAASISAPLLTKLAWDDDYDSGSVHLGMMAHLQYLRVRGYLVYHGHLYGVVNNLSCLWILPRFEGIKNLSLRLVYPRVIENYDYMMEDMAVLPNITSLSLTVRAYGHAFEASAFHVLRLCTGIRSLHLLFAATVSEDQTVCTSDCKCLELTEWKTEELLLNHLEKVEISGWRGTEHEVAFVKRLFDWGTMLKEMTVKSFSLISEVKAKEVYQTFQSFSRPGVCIKVYRYEFGLEGVIYT